MRAAARKPAKAQMITFWKNVACTAVFTAVKVPYWPLFVLSSRSGTGVAVFLAMTNPVQAQSSGTNPEQLSRLLELDLIQKRSAWQQAKQRKKSYRSLAFLF